MFWGLNQKTSRTAERWCDFFWCGVVHGRVGNFHPQELTGRRLYFYYAIYTTLVIVNSMVYSERGVSMASLNDRIAARMNFDGLKVAEDLTGKSYKDDYATMLTGLLLHSENSRALNALLAVNGDTSNDSSVEQYLAVVNDLGFEKCLEIPFQGLDCTETFYVFFLVKYGILLVFETWCGNSIHSSRFYYNFRFEGVWPRVYSSGCLARQNHNVWVGHHDGREGLRFNIENIARTAEFLPVWVEQYCSLWLVNYMECRNDCFEKRLKSYEEISTERLSMLPEHVQKAILNVS